MRLLLLLLMILRYYTGVLEMGEFNGPVEAQLFAMTTCFITAAAGAYFS